GQEQEIADLEGPIFVRGESRPPGGVARKVGLGILADDLDEDLGNDAAAPLRPAGRRRPEPPPLAGCTATVASHHPSRREPVPCGLVASCRARGPRPPRTGGPCPGLAAGRARRATDRRSPQPRR